MNIFNLPDDIVPAKKGKRESIIIYPYAARVGSFKGKSILHTNAISLVISGEKTMHFASKTVHIKNDEIHFLSAGNCLASLSFSGKEIFRSILVFFDNKTLSDFYVKYATRIAKIKSRHKITSEPFVSFRKDPFILNFITSLELMFQRSQKLSMEMRVLKFEELMLYLFEKYPGVILSFQASERKDLNDLEIRKVVESNITNSLSVEELAFLCNTSLSTFKRRFVKIYGTSPNKWILQKRMELARHLLQHYHEKPGEVCHKVGYENHSSFSQSFKHTYGVTPRDFQLGHLNVQR
ncbi:MAG: AraC family transcriptional regulator [Bacteroidota bacterium]|nr:AraC family transcriptional regulator [Bacteroidota bacterium]